MAFAERDLYPVCCMHPGDPRSCAARDLLTRPQVSEVRKDVHMIRHEIDQLQTAKVEMEELRQCVERLEEEQRRRKARSANQVRWTSHRDLIYIEMPHLC